MARAHCREVVTSDKIGALAPIPFATVNVYETGTTTPIAQTIYSSATGVGTLTNPLTADANGLIEFWLPEAQVADLLISASGYTSQTVTTNVAGPTGTASNLNTSQALSVAGDVIVNASAPFLQFKDDAGTPATHSVPVLDAVQTFTAEQAITVSGSGTANLVLGNSTDSTGRIAGNTGCSLVMVPATGTSFNVWSNGKNGQALTVDDASGLTTLDYGLKVAAGNVGIGTAPVTWAGNRINGTTVIASGGNNIGFLDDHTFDSGATGDAVSFRANPSTAAAAFTVARLIQFHAETPTKGSGSTVTSSYGLLVDSQTAGSTNNYGVYINAPSGGSGANFALYANGMISLGLGSGLFGTLPRLGIQQDANGHDGILISRFTDAAPTGDLIRVINAASSLSLFEVQADGGVTSASTITAQDGTAVPAGGSVPALAMSSAASKMGIYFGSGAPTVSAAKGSVYLRSDGSSTSTRLYVNTDGSTTWTGVATAA